MPAFLFAGIFGGSTANNNKKHLCVLRVWYDEGILAVSRPAELWEMRPGRVIVATGSYENPMIFENNDLPGIFTEVFVSGGARGSRGVDRAWLEGKIAGLSAALDLGYGREDVESMRDDATALLNRFHTHQS